MSGGEAESSGRLCGKRESNQCGTIAGNYITAAPLDSPWILFGQLLEARIDQGFLHGCRGMESGGAAGNKMKQILG